MVLHLQICHYSEPRALNFTCCVFVNASWIFDSIWLSSINSYFFLLSAQTATYIMAHFGLENDVNSLICMDAPLARAPMMRWQRKMNTDNMNISKSDSMLNSSAIACVNQSIGATSKTPMKQLNLSQQHSSRSTGSNGSLKTPGKHTQSKTPSMYQF